MRRRHFLQSALAGAAALAAPHIVRAQGAKTITFVPHADLASLDPVWTTADITRNFSLAVYDTLFGYDAGFKIQPQMVEGHATGNDGREWSLTLRDGLKFHDGTPVLARDCVATIKRYAKRYPMGQALAARTDELSAVSDKVIRFRLKRPFSLLPDALAEPYCSIMPERLARTDPFDQVKEAIGCGAVQIRRRRAHPRPAIGFREKPGLCSARERQAELHRRSQSRLYRPRGVEFRAGPVDRLGGAGPGRGRLVGEPDDRSCPAAQNQ